MQRQGQVISLVGATLCLGVGGAFIYYGVSERVLLKHDVDVPLPINTVLLLVGIIVRLGCIFAGLAAGVHATSSLSIALTNPHKGATIRQLAGLAGISTEQPGEAVRVMNLTWWPIALVLWAWTSSILSKYSFVQGQTFEVHSYPSITGYNARYCGGAAALGEACPWSPSAAIANTTTNLQRAIMDMGGNDYSQPLPGGLFTSPAVATDETNNFYVLPMPDMIFQGLQSGLRSLNINNCPLIQISSHCSAVSSAPTFEPNDGQCTHGDGLLYCSSNSTGALKISVQEYVTLTGTACTISAMSGTGNTTWLGTPGDWVASVNGPVLAGRAGYELIADLVEQGSYYLGAVQTATRIFTPTDSGPWVLDASRVGAAVAMIFANSAFYSGNGALGETQSYSGSGFVQKNVVLAHRWGALATGVLFIILALGGISGVFAASRRQLAVTAEQFFHAAASNEVLVYMLAVNAMEGTECDGKFGFVQADGRNELRPV